MCIVAYQVATTGRRLLNAIQYTKDVKIRLFGVVTTTGADEGIQQTVDTLQASPCELKTAAGLGVCDIVGSELQSTVVSDQVATKVEFSAVVESYTAGNLQIRTTYLADGNRTTLLTPWIANGTADSTDFLPCTARPVDGTFLFTCDVSVPLEDILRVTVMVVSMAQDADGAVQKIAVPLDIPGSREAGGCQGEIRKGAFFAAVL